MNSFTQHELARDWLDQQLNAAAPVGLPWASLVAFLRLVTNPRVFDHPEPIGDAWQQVRTWLAAETVWVPHPTERHADILGEFLALPGIHANLVPDAHRAALDGTRLNLVFNRWRFCTIWWIALAKCHRAMRIS